MNIIEKYDPYFVFTGVLVNLFIALQFLAVWVSPRWDQATQIETLAVLMGFEFIMVHSGVFMAVFPKKFSLFIFFPVYGLFAVAFALMIDDWHIIAFTYLFAIFNRMRFAFADVPQHIKSRNMLTSILAVVIYFFLVMFVAFAADLIPTFGLTDAYLNASGYKENLDAGGLFLDEPQTAICLGVLYYGVLALVEFYLVRRNQKLTTSKS